jgi:hypothetical protein
VDKIVWIESRVEVHPDYRRAHVGSNVFSLFQIIRVTHMINLEAEQMRLEQKLHGMMLAGDDFTVYAARFNDILVGLTTAGSKLSDSRLVFVFLRSLRGSPLQTAADRWLDNTRQDGFPTSCTWHG